MKYPKWLPVFTLALVIGLSLAGCGKKSANLAVGHTVVAEDIQEMLATAGAITTNAFFADPVYALPSERWLANEYSAALYSFLQAFKSIGYVEAENDCDNYSTLAFAFAQVLHHNTPQKTKKTALAVGEFWYASQALGGVHAINVALVWEDSTGYKLVFYEPQKQQIVTLTKAEIAGVKYYRF